MQYTPEDIGPAFDPYVSSHWQIEIVLTDEWASWSCVEKSLSVHSQDFTITVKHILFWKITSGAHSETELYT